MSFYPHNVDYNPGVQASGGGRAIASAKVADLLKYEVAPQNTSTTSLHAAKLLSAPVQKTAAATVCLALAQVSDTTLTVTVTGTLAVGDVLKDAAKTEWVKVTSITNAPVYTVERAYHGTALATHAGGATWDLVAQEVLVTLLAAELAACPQLVEIKGVGGTLAGDVHVVGTDINNGALDETIALNAAAAVPSVNAFKTVTKYIVPLQVAGSDSVSLGLTKSIGLPWKIVSLDYMLLHLFDGSIDAGAVTYDAATLSKNVYAPAGTPNGTKKVTLFVAH